MTVTPFVGVWIETSESVNNKICQWSHPSWVCGLKRLYGNHYNAALGSHPSWVCGLKLMMVQHLRKWLLSHPSWVCGLKQTPYSIFASIRRHTLRGCVD